DDDEWFLRARAQIVHRARDQLLAGSRLALDQDGDVRLGQPLDRASDLLHARAGRDQARHVGWRQRRLGRRDGRVEQDQYRTADADARPDRDDRFVDAQVADEGPVAAAQVLDHDAVLATQLEVIVADGG